MKQQNKSSPKFEPITAADAVALAVKAIPIEVQRHIMGEIQHAAMGGWVHIWFNCMDHNVDVKLVDLWLGELGYTVNRRGENHATKISWGQ